MNYIALLGAGFSRNWGGWLAEEVFEYLLGCPEVQEDGFLKNLLWKYTDKGGFETALGELQIECANKPDQNKIKSLEAFLQSLENMFVQMDEGFDELKDLNFSNDADKTTDVFLARFDAIFSLNQDILFERYYSTKVETASSRAKRHWNGFQIPGMQQRHDQGSRTKPREIIWDEKQPYDFKIEKNSQPLFKLHGSFNWKPTNALQRFPLMILGGNKPQVINHYKVLKWYHEEFSHRLSQTNTRLMVIGYGFGDDHINTLLCKAAETGDIKTFIIDPLGFRTIGQHNSTRGLVGQKKTNVEEALEPTLIGASRRSLPSIFGDDNVEFEKVMKFFT